MPDDPSEPRNGARPPRGVALSLLISMGAWLFFGSPMGGNRGGPLEESAGGWVVLPADRSEGSRCGWDGTWAILRYQGAEPDRVGEDLAVQPGDRWEFENGWEAAEWLRALAGEPLPGAPQEGMDAEEIAEFLQSAPATWRYGGRTACVVGSGDSPGPTGR
ncbi:hypothetical protein [Streptomyces sp. ST2-7A]|uniref:hypothetical protein n=1 Tax=Streptomyces sp. ST2-7A TaxID=2907214 RepID=UPI001F3ABAAF|nr:hypothetical protein [Streptomyces sp. ST2-7A]MCE7082285.1 hypothetical protein [Streptomyces sp. ST2-7A]